MRPLPGQQSFALSFVWRIGMALSGGAGAAPDDPLPSWCEGAAKSAIMNFVARVTTADSPDYVAPEERIAAFDNDGTLWAERPYYFQLAFALDQVKTLAPLHPEWEGKEPFKSALAGDVEALFARGESALVEIVTADRARVVVDDASSADQKAVHRNGVSADAGTAYIAARKRLQDLHRLWRRHRVHAGLC
jgi:hypothetical protein